MQTVKQKVSNAAASAKERVDVLKAKAEGKADKSMASSKEDKAVAKEQKKAKEAEANMRKHEDKAGNAAVHLQAKQPVTQGNQVPPGHAAAARQPQYDQAVPPTNAEAPTQEPLEGHRPGLE